MLHLSFMYQITLVAAQQLPQVHLFAEAEKLGLEGASLKNPTVLQGLRANAPTHAERDAVAAPIDILWRRQNAPKPKLFLADMDATMVIEETIDELAAKAGIGAEIKAITDKAKTGQIAFEEALRARVALFKGVKTDLLEETKKGMNLMPGAAELLRALKQMGVYTVLVSGGFTQFTGYIAEKLGFDHHIGNQFGIENGVLTGELLPPLIHRAAKKDALEHFAQKLGCDMAEAITIGDGANDIDMLQAAGFGVGFQPKPIVAQSVDRLIKHGSLTTVLEVF